MSCCLLLITKFQNRIKMDNSSQKTSAEDAIKKSFMETFQERFETIAKPSDRTKFTLEIMGSTLSQKGTLRFKDFWELKKICLSSFKEIDNPILRTNLWEEYLLLIQEAKRLKEILDQQSFFAIEQIDLAIEALMNDLNDAPQKIQSFQRIEFPKEAQTLRDREKTYNQNQLTVSFLTALSRRIQALRKETIDTEMRIRHKNRLLQKLSQTGDLVFPRKKQLVQEISSAFAEDIDRFMQENFSDPLNPGVKKNGKTPPLYIIKEEIKAFQRMAKILSLTPECFAKSRQQLSECFTSVKNKEKERRDRYLEMKEQCQEDFDRILENIGSFSEQINAENLTQKQFDEKVAEISKTIKETTLVKDQVKLLKDQLLDQINKGRKKITDQDNLRKQEDVEKEKQKRAQSIAFLEDLQSKMAALSNDQTEQILAFQQQVKDQASSLAFTYDQQVTLSLLLEDVHQKYLEKKYQDLVSEGVKEFKAIEALLEEKSDFRERIKNRLEELRRLCGASGLDFEKAILYRECIDKERNRFESLTESVESIEELLMQLDA